MTASKLITSRRLAACIFISLFLGSCSRPFIRSFTVVPHTITAADSVQINWDVRGTPTLFYHERTAADSTKLLEFTLIVHNNGRDSSRMVQVEKLTANATTQIIFNTQLSGDTLVATGIKNPEKWSNFQVVTVASASGRELMVEHADKSAVLGKNDPPSSSFAQTILAGKWTIKSLLTAAEKQNHSIIPEQLAINANIQAIRK